MVSLACLLSLLALFIAAPPSVRAGGKPEIVSMRLEPHRKRCFVEMLQKGTVVLIELDGHLHHATTHQKIEHVGHHVVVSAEEPNGHVLMRQNAKPNSRVFLTAAQDGEHTICLSPLLSQYIPNVYLDLFSEVFMGEARDPRITSPMEAHLYEFGYALSKSNDLVAEVLRDLGLQSMREREFHLLSEHLLRLVVALAASQTLIIVGMAGFQWWSMRGFFRSKKLV